MHCPRCDWPNYDPTKPCRHCHFKGDPAAIEALQHTTWLLSDMGRWPEDLGLDPEIQQRLEQYYTGRRKALEIKLALREPPFTAEEAPRAWVRLRQLEGLQTRVAVWREQHYLSEVAIRDWVEKLARASATQRERLAGHTPPSVPLTDAER
ncbi:MAG: hypothetical protein J7M17_02900, partial [Anaerolineae bacterium]|nr:hypothetical protein [Anaerolineae bacterium]